MQSVLSAKEFEYPYRDIKFPGQHSEENILFVTRQGALILWFKMVFILFITLCLLITAIILYSTIKSYIPNTPSIILVFSLLIIASINPFLIWWTYSMWKKSVFIITTRRLTKFIHTTPWTRYQLSLALDKIADTGAYQKGWFQAISGYGYFVARSAAGNIKNFKIINISFAEDLHNYVNKLLYDFNNHPEKVDKFRPFIPHLKGEARKSFVRRITPEYYQEGK